jgi:hypothetical protein
VARHNWSEVWERGGRGARWSSGGPLARPYPWTVSHIRPGDHLTIRGVDRVEGRVLRVDRDGLLVDWGGRLGTVRHPWSEVGDRFARVPRRAGGHYRSA